MNSIKIATSSSPPTNLQLNHFHHLHRKYPKHNLEGNAARRKRAMSSLSAADSLASNTTSGQSILPNGKKLNQEEETGTTKPSAKVIVTFFARPRASLWRSSPRIGFSPCLEFDFTGLLASLASNTPPAIPSFESLSPSVYQATYTTSALDTLNLRHHPLVSAFETTHGVEMVFDVLTESTTSHRPVQLVIFDMDSTLIKEEVIDELARSIGVTSAVSAITERAMNGEIDFAESLRARLALLKGVPTSIWKELENSLSIATGAKELCAELRRKGVITAVASGGFIPMAEWLKDQLGLDYAFANHVSHRFPARWGPDRFFSPFALPVLNLHHFTRIPSPRPICQLATPTPTTASLTFNSSSRSRSPHQVTRSPTSPGSYPLTIQ